MTERESREKTPSRNRRRRIWLGLVLLLLLSMGSHALKMQRCFSRAHEEFARNPDASRLWVRTTGFSLFMKCEYGCNPAPQGQRAKVMP